MTRPDPGTRVYTGIGARATPAAVLDDMTAMAAWLARTGWHLASSGARRADTAFANGAPAAQGTVCYLPWQHYGALSSRLATQQHRREPLHATGGSAPEG